MSDVRDYLLLVEDAQGVREFRLGQTIYSLGRSEGCDVQLFSQTVSRRHATLMRMPTPDGSKTYRLVDGDPNTGQPSANGTYVNGERVRSVNLSNCDEIIFGSDARARFFCIGDENSAEWQALMDAPTLGPQ